jgi:UDP-N-acetylglucosamine transferase subunit ALG13
MTAAGHAGAPGPDVPRFVVTVGTDHHPFDRLIRWINDWLGQHPERTPAFVVQRGSASVAPVCRGSRFLDAGQLGALLDSADVMICHGGPGSIADAWARGQVPIAVPRLRRLGEVVDDHQVDFCRKLAGLGRVRLAQDPAVLAELLDEAIGDRARFRMNGPAADVDAAVARFGTLVDELVGRPRSRLPLYYRVRQTRRGPKAGAGSPVGTGDLLPGLAPAVSTNCRASRHSANAGSAEMANEEQG